MDITIAIPVIVAIVEGLKSTGLPSRAAFIVSLVLGLVGFYFLGEGTLEDNLFAGVIAGLSASGLYSGTVKPIRNVLQ